MEVPETDDPLLAVTLLCCYAPLREEEIVIALVASAKKDSEENDEVGDALERMDAAEHLYLLFSSLLEASSNIC